MQRPSITVATEALALGIVLPAVLFGVWALNPMVVVAAAGVALIHAIVLGLPLFLLLRRFGWVNVLTSTVSGVLVGGTPAAIAFMSTPGQFVPFAAFGGASGLVFGLWLWYRAKDTSKSTVGSAPIGAADIDR